MFNSPYLLTFQELIITKTNLNAIMEYVNGGSIFELLAVQGGRFTETVARKILIQLVQGISAIYSKKVGHKNLSLKAILIHFPNLGNNLSQSDLKEVDLEKEDFQIKIADFGLKRYCEMDSDNCDFVLFDELIFKKECKYNLDTWAFGFMFFEMVAGIQLTSESAITQFKQNEEPSLTLTKDCHSFLSELLNPDQSKRPAWELLNQHPYLSSSFDPDTALSLSISESDAYNLEEDALHMPIGKFRDLYSEQLTNFLTKYIDKIDMTIRKVVVNQNSEVLGIFEQIAATLEIELMGFESIGAHNSLDQSMDVGHFQQHLAQIAGDGDSQGLKPVLKKSVDEYYSDRLENDGVQRDSISEARRSGRRGSRTAISKKELLNTIDDEKTGQPCMDKCTI